jgi:hypothetical protein
MGPATALLPTDPADAPSPALGIQSRSRATSSTASTQSPPGEHPKAITSPGNLSAMAITRSSSALSTPVPRATTCTGSILAARRRRSHPDRGQTHHPRQPATARCKYMRRSKWSSVELETTASKLASPSPGATASSNRSVFNSRTYLVRHGAILAAQEAPPGATAGSERHRRRESRYADGQASDVRPHRSPIVARREPAA